jgi:hypothetical protein
MGFDFGAFAGGLGTGVDRGMKLVDSIDDMQRKVRIQKLREEGMAEAESQRANSVQGMVKESGVASGQPTSGPIETASPAVASSTPVRQAPPSGTPLPPAQPMPGVGASAEGVQGEAEAASAMQAPKVDVVQPTPQVIAATGVAAKPNGKFTVNGKSYDTREQAMAAAEKAAPSAQDFFMKNAVPKIAAEYMVQGDPAKAKAWQDFSESHNGKRAIKDWAAAYSAPDFDTAATRFGKYYTDHIDDGVDYTGHRMLTKADGSQVAVVALKDKATGATTEMELTREKMLAMGGANNPQKLFENEQAKQAAGEKMRYEAGLKSQERKAKREDELHMEGVKAGTARSLEEMKQDRLDKREGLKSDREVARESAKVNSKIDAQVSSLRDAGYSDDDIKKMMPSLVGAGDHKKTTDPTERRALIASDLLKNDAKFGRLTQGEQNKRVDDMMGVIYRDEKKAPAKPAVLDKPMAYNKELPVKYRKSDGKPFHLVDGKYVPIDGSVPTSPQAGGLPK